MENFSSDITAAAEAVVAPAPQPVHIEAEEVPRFEPQDPAMLEHLQEHGFAVVKSVLDGAAICAAEDRLWACLEGATPLRREDPNTWTTENLNQIGMPRNGILRGPIGQSEFLWGVRRAPRVRAAFAAVWGTDELLTSMDGANIFLPWHREGLADAKTSSGWFHVDQGNNQRGFKCVQGIVTLLDCNEHTGGFSLIPGSHKYHEELLSVAGREENFVTVPADFRVLRMKQIMPSFRAGDLILWDSRTVHCSSPALADPTSPPDRLLREIAYVCMTPRAWAASGVIENRVAAYERGMSLYHWPHLITHAIPEDLPIVRSIVDAPPQVQELVGLDV